MCGIHVYVCKCEEITTPQLPLSLSLSSFFFFDTGSLTMPDDHQLVKLPSEP